MNEKIMLAVPVGETFYQNMQFNLYEDAKKGDYAYLGLYKDKAIRAVGKVTKIVEVKSVDGKLSFSENLTDDEKNRLLAYRDCFSNSNYSIAIPRTRVFFVEKFYATNYVNVGTTGIVGGKKFLLDNFIESGFTAEDIAAELDGQTWKLEKGKDIIPDIIA